MKGILVVVFCWVGFTGQAQATDADSRLAASFFKEAESASQHQRIWPVKVYGPTLLVDPASRVTYSNEPDSAGLLKPDEGIYKGVLPTAVMIANTSILWQGRRWSVILWPLPAGRDDRRDLMLHESFHRIQVKLGLPERSPTADHLSSMNGRIYFLLELRALKAALGKPVDQRQSDLTSALLFRAKRQELFPNTFENERILEMSEGLAEYTGLILGRQKDSIRPHLYQEIDSAGDRKSLIRSLAHFTGPAYGYLLYEKSPGWTLKVDSNSDFALLISRAYRFDLPKHPVSEAVAGLEGRYNGESIVRSEKLKEEIRLQMVQQYTELFTQKSVLTIELIKMGINFNPNNLFDLGEYGTVYPTAEVKDNWGKVTVSSTGVLMKDWKVITLPAPEGIRVNGRWLTGKGWELLLNEHWELVKADALHYKLVMKE
ncbi:MAG TPA: hypothetical protein VL832_06065 [Puia sp.]|jgi:hypothetical protein|nr:hypothetical protein [Puia sp.]